MAANGKQKNRRSLKVAKGAYPLPIGDVYGITDKGFYLDKNGDPYRNEGGRLVPDGDYRPRRHGALIPDGLVQKNKNRGELLAGNFPARIGTPLTQEDALKAIQTANQNRLAGGMTRSQYNKFRKILGAQLMIGEV